ncbi:MAG TPA: MFS transporter [Kineosporiaceae bacterium]|nr:MFS transporter [Kineosporiaceae bacterium]
MTAGGQPVEPGVPRFGQPVEPGTTGFGQPVEPWAAELGQPVWKDRHAPASPSPSDGVPGGLRGALAEPTVPVSALWTTLLALANLGLWMGYFGPLQVLLPLQVEQIDAAHKTTLLGIATGVGAFVAALLNPVFGAMSDRTTSRFGRRRPWAVAGGLFGFAGMAFLAGQTTIAGVALGWCLAQAGLNAMQAAITASVPDNVPVRQRATVSGWIGAPQSLGVVVAVVLVTTVTTGIASGYLLIGALAFLLVIPFALFTRDPQLPGELRPPFSWGDFLRGFWISPRRHPDFAWAWGTRFLVQLGNAMGTLYLLYYLKDQVHYEQVFPGKKAEDGLLVLILIYTAAAVMATIVGGVISDRSGRRKRSVTVSGLLMAVPGVTLALWPTWPVAMASAVVMGIGFGAYLSVDQALVTQVLPAAEDRARDLGVINIASSMPQVLGPFLAGPLVSAFGGYPTLYLAVAVITVIGSVMVRRIKSVP